MAIQDGDRLYRHCVFPIQFRKNAFCFEKFIRLKLDEEGILHGSLAWGQYVNTPALVHAYGCRLAAYINVQDQQTERYKEGRRKIYSGAYEMKCSAIRTLPATKDLSEIRSADVVHLPENGEESHADLKITLNSEPGSDLEGIKTAIIDRLWNNCFGPMRYVCECDSLVSPHPSTYLESAPLGDISSAVRAEEDVPDAQ